MLVGEFPCFGEIEPDLNASIRDEAESRLVCTRNLGNDFSIFSIFILLSTDYGG